jgi:hypothetical protein
MRSASKKDYTAVREKTERFRDALVKKTTSADLKDHGGAATVRMRWHLNQASERDMVFLLEINGEKAYLDLEELMSYTRLI